MWGRRESQVLGERSKKVMVVMAHMLNLRCQRVKFPDEHLETLALSSDNRGWGVSGIEEVGKSTGGGRTAQATVGKEEKAMARVPSKEP